MGKKYYKKSVPKKSTKQIPICGDCLLDPTDSDLKPWDFYWVQQNGYHSLACINCVKKEEHTVIRQYAKKSGKSK